MARAHPGGMRRRTAGSSRAVVRLKAMVSQALTTVLRLRPTSPSTSAGGISPLVHATQYRSCPHCGLA
eukprot:10167767-Lingulodinium_polyedra.AAC.1